MCAQNYDWLYLMQSTVICNAIRSLSVSANAKKKFAISQKLEPIQKN